MINKAMVIITAVFFLLVTLLTCTAFHYYGKSVSQADTLSTVTQQKNTAEFIAKSQALTVSIFNTIAGASLNEQHANTLESQAAQDDIKSGLAGDPCAPVVVPARSNNRVLDRYNSVRKSSGNADTSQPSPVVPAIAPTK